MNLAPSAVTQLTKADAPLQWYKSVDTCLRSLGFVRSRSDPVSGAGECVEFYEVPFVAMLMTSCSWEMLPTPSGTGQRRIWPSSVSVFSSVKHHEHYLQCLVGLICR